MIDIPDSKSENILDQLIIRHAVAEDLPALEWNGELTHYRRLFADVFRYTERGDAFMWLAELLNAGIIGQVFVHINSQRLELADGISRAYIYGFRVRSPYRNMGIGTYMMNVVEADLSQRGFQLVSLNVGRDNPGARRLYEKLGYEVVGAEQGRWSYIDDKGVVQNVHEPAWRMQKQLGSASPGAASR
jgi:ribosomal protein S18 acetylase RimI-like enzyme